jgi:hypothetical protein
MERALFSSRPQEIKIQQAHSFRTNMTGMFRDFTYAAGYFYRPVQHAVLFAVEHSLAYSSLV